ncbi:MAG: bifunctional DNA-formamidopyrimidine glycosylase/DNA-(apurinic or apyrimidinic site) lyase [Candidatus Moranbacteria bacterium]|nr:bifunctional DNA-formamidopyrimidine glycosylase/DNA-(apurinic or apyrimidinic site) lyase [Candidatus Moranbacteria bacterium]
MQTKIIINSKSMPELPEVETVKRDLNKKIRGFKVVDFWTDWEKSIKMPLEEFKQELIGREVRRIKRRAKNILIEFNEGKVMLVHLKMTGHLLVKGDKCKVKRHFSDRVNQYIHHIWYLKSADCQRSDKYDHTLEFSDMRKFGKIKLYKKGELDKDKELQKLGIEPLSEKFSLKELKGALARKEKTSIKTILLDQSLIAGIGNIYASEILFEAGIDPGRSAGQLKEREIEALFQAIKRVLHEAVKLRGTSDSDYRDTAGAPGSFQKVLKVYNRKGEKCRHPKCNSKIERIKIGQRSTYYCPKCQK